MRLAFVSQPWNNMALPIETGSIAIWTYEIARRLHAGGDFKVDVYARNIRRKNPDYQSEAGVDYWYIRAPLEQAVTRAEPSTENMSGVRDPFHWTPDYSKDYVRQIGERVARRRPDIIHIINFAPFAPVLREFCPSARIVLNMHCDWLAVYDRTLTARYLDSVDLVLTCSEHLAGQIHSRFPGQSCRAVLNAVDENVFHPARRRTDPTGLRILFVGRMSPEKGVHVLCEAFERLVKKRPNARLYLAGPKSMADRSFIVDSSRDPIIRDLARFYAGGGNYLRQVVRSMSWRARRRVSYLGSRDHESIAALCRECDIMVNPSLWEPFGITVIEAMASGLPVIGSDVDGMRETIDNGRTGFLVPPDDVSALADALEQLAADPELRQSMGEAGRARAVGHFTYERTTVALAEMYRELAIGRQSPDTGFRDDWARNGSTPETGRRADPRSLR